MKIAVCVESTPSRAVLWATLLASALTEAELWWVHAGDKPLDLGKIPDVVAGVASVVAPQLEHAHDTTLAMVLAATIARLQCSLVLVGMHSDAEGSGLMGAAIAVKMAVPYVSQVFALTLDAAHNRVEASVHMNVDDVTFRCTLPAVFACVSDSDATFTYAAEKRHEVFTLEDLKIDAATLRKASVWNSRSV